MTRKTFKIRKDLTVEHKGFGVRGTRAYRCTQTDLNTGKASTWEGITQTKNLPTPDNLIPGGSDWAYLKNSVITEIAEYGWAGRPNKHGRYEFDVWNDPGCSTPYSDTSGEFTLCRIDGSSHLLFELRNGVETILPKALHFNYIDGVMRDGAYDIDKASAHLEKHKQIKDFKRERVPYYNSDPGCREGMEFRWVPTAKQFRKVWERAQEIGSAYPSTNLRQAVFELDLLGLTKCGAAKYDTFHGCYSGTSYDDDE